MLREEEEDRHHAHRKTKIMCTVGKHTCTLKSIVRLIEAGMNVARIAMPMLRSEIENRQNGQGNWDWGIGDVEDDLFNDGLTSAQPEHQHGEEKLGLSSLI